MSLLKKEFVNLPYGNFQKVTFLTGDKIKRIVYVLEYYVF